MITGKEFISELTDITCENCGKVIASAQWRWLRTRSYHEQGHCKKTLKGKSLDRYFLDKEHALQRKQVWDDFRVQHEKWVKYPKRLANVQLHCPHKETKTLYSITEDGYEVWTLTCLRCFKHLEEEHSEGLVIPVREE